MGRIDATIPDELESQFRIEIIKRYGGKKGDLQRAVEEAIDLWIYRQTVEKLKAQAMSRHLLVTEREQATKLLGELGDSALDALLEIGNCNWLLVTERDTARKMARQVISKNKKFF